MDQPLATVSITITQRANDLTATSTYTVTGYQHRIDQVARNEDGTKTMRSVITFDSIEDQ